LRRTLGNAYYLAWALHNLGCLTIDEGDAAAVRPMLDEALRLAVAVTTLGATLDLPMHVLEQRMLRRAQAVEPSLAAAAVARARAEGAALTLEQAVAEALGEGS